MIFGWARIRNGIVIMVYGRGVIRVLQHLECAIGISAFDVIAFESTLRSYSLVPEEERVSFDLLNDLHCY